MSQLRFQHVFVALMALSGLSAFALPVKVSGRSSPQISMLFAPIARPAAAIASFLFHRMGGDLQEDSRDLETIRRENQELKAAVAALTQQNNTLAQRGAELDKLGPVRDLCVLVSVVGADAGMRESLSLRSSTLEGIKDGLFVLYPGGVVGQIERAGVVGAQVRLLTDPGFRVRGSFGKFHRRADNQIEFSKLNAPTALVEGAGAGLDDRSRTDDGRHPQGRGRDQ